MRLIDIDDKENITIVFDNEGRGTIKRIDAPIIQALPIEVLDKIKGYVDHIRNTGMGKKKSLEFIEKFIEGLKAESEE